MQVVFQLELKVDCADDNMRAAYTKTWQKLARHALAVASLIPCSGAKPRVFAFSNDYFGTHEQIEMFGDMVQEGIDEIGNPDETPISQELLNALK